MYQLHILNLDSVLASVKNTTLKAVFCNYFEVAYIQLKSVFTSDIIPELTLSFTGVLNIRSDSFRLTCTWLVYFV